MDCEDPDRHPDHNLRVHGAGDLEEPCGGIPGSYDRSNETLRGSPKSRSIKSIATLLPRTAQLLQRDWRPGFDFCVLLNPLGNYMQA